MLRGLGFNTPLNTNNYIGEKEDVGQSMQQVDDDFSE